jgi:hypothetical protein
VQEVEAQKIWDFLGQTEMALVPLGFSPIHSREPAREVSNVLPVLDSMGARMLTLEEVVNEQLEVKCHILAEKVAEHVLTCFWSWDPQNLPGAGGARTHHRGGGGGQGQCPGCHQDRGCNASQKTHRAPAPAFVSIRTF